MCLIFQYLVFIHTSYIIYNNICIHPENQILPLVIRKTEEKKGKSLVLTSSSYIE